MAVYEFPTSFGQRRMWLLAQMDPDEPTYNIAWALWLDGDLDLDTLQRAWEATLLRHEVLRTTFRDESGMPVQVIEDEPTFQALELTSVEHLPADEREPAARALIGELARTPILPAVGPLLRVRLVRLSADRHVLAVVMHHIVADGWSFRILFSELSADYEALPGGGEAVTEEPAIQYADFALWQLEHAEGGEYAQAERFWRAELADAPAALGLPVDRPYPALQTFAADGLDSQVDPALAAQLRQAAVAGQTTVFAVLLAAYAAVLARLSGERDLLVAVPMAARTRPETESVIGLFMNTVPIRISVDPEASLGELARSVHAATARALAHQELPFARVVELLRPERDPARLPLTQVMFAMEESWAVPDRGGLRWRPELLENGTAKFELELTVTDAPSGPRVRLNYNRDLFDASTGRLLADGFSRVLRAFAENADQAVGEAEIMSDELYELVTRSWPDAGPVAEPGSTAVTQLWRACAGDTVLARGSDGALTGDQIRRRAQQIAAALRAHGIDGSDRVAILLRRGARLVPAVLGVWSLGASYVPLDEIYPDQRLATMLADARVRAILIDSAAVDAPRPPATAEPIAVIDLARLSPEPALSHVSDAPSDSGSGDGLQSAALDAAPVVAPAAAAYTMFTSGSTGRPKAVTVTQGGIAALLDAVRPMLALGPEDRFVAVSTFAFDIALVELLAPVLAGGCVVVADSEHTQDAALLRRLLLDSGATAMQSTPAGWRMLVDVGGVPDGVRVRMTAGEPLSRDLADAIGGGPQACLWNLYGPTETTIYSGGGAVEASPAPIEIGSIIAGTQLYVLDDRLRPVPPGVLGEVYVGGAGVGQGYFGAPGMTASRFLPDPFSGRPGARLYRTGDVGRWRSSGRIELAGRADRQVKIRGYRVESGEIEAVLRAQPDIAEAVVSVRGAGHDVRLVAYLVTASGSDQPPEDLRERLRQVLPDYMTPAAFVVLKRLPLTGSGKIDHRALPEPEWGTAPGEATVAPRTPLESELAAMFAELLALPAPVGVTDNFFALGGHSLTATRLMTQIRTAYGVDLPVRALFADPTVAGLAAAVEAARSGSGGGARRTPAIELSDAETDDLLRTLIPDERR
ncbi:MAG TPA: amino acid adenylation domain-containing protein [Jatrophihabitans sp.]|jgi:amino acid adenylation domain-containing protein|uniref:amino acid adenylation domain-containing protein n=1 Tax=Jatrophihabitans sp. TaxID=1932789 RepID=UPI002F0CF3A8